MTAVEPEERTLDVLVGGRRALAAKVERTVGPNRQNLGTTFIAIGAALVVGIRALYGLSWFVGQWTLYPAPGLALAAWIVLAVALAGGFLATRLLGDPFPGWMFGVFLALAAIAVALDLAAVWPLHDVGRHATAALTATMSITLFVTLRPVGQLIAAASAFGAVIAIAMGFTTAAAVASAPEGVGAAGAASALQEAIAPQITSLGFAVLPVVIAAVAIRGFRRLVQVELDRALVQSTVSAPRFAVGMLASEELARLDLAAEDLLDSVAQGRTPLPLDPKTASVAATLATELRLHLIEGRRETWLYHAISESELLGRAVSVDDRGGLAGLLDPGQRDGLLGAIWALASDGTRPIESTSLSVTIGPIAPGASADPQLLLVPIELEAAGVPRNRVDPSTWDSVRRVGRYSDSTQKSTLRVRIECLVANPARI
ncbi:hypothetical protein QT381_14190 [Galbitalea sp. SE-J8]|uniref:hypothetical protein n=1 Tax=Galbitalea sp. SE-J8 TaxID=3054952 RepID=UPI00259C6DF6|nr:hypothetical protein [Galbitalea sp. SE-J8]MDM4764156.1 hypothetical protein [Galbitalea sp. SE-J8]